MFELAPEQRDVVEKIVRNRYSYQIQTLGGYAGTGKTTVIKTLANELEKYAICAFTGKAANVLQKKGMYATTIHSLIYKRFEDDYGNPQWELKEPALLECRGFLVDEASMVSQDLYQDLLSFDRPIVFVGDHGQLEPVGSTVNIMADPMYRLEKIHRNAGEIAWFAEHIRNGKPATEFKAESKVVFIEPKNITDDLLKNSSQMICAFNRTRVGRNERVRELLGRRKIVEAGEQIMCLKNSREFGLFNGMQGEVIRAHYSNGPKLDFVSNHVRYQNIPYDPDQFGQEKSQTQYQANGPIPFDYGYCITAHKAQGDEWDDVTVFEERCQHWDHKRWAYTAASRAKEKLVWVAASQRRPSALSTSTAIPYN